MDHGTSLLEEGISQQTLNELLGITDDTDIKDAHFSNGGANCGANLLVSSAPTHLSVLDRARSQAAANFTNLSMASQTFTQDLSAQSFEQSFSAQPVGRKFVEAPFLTSTANVTVQPMMQTQTFYAMASPVQSTSPIVHQPQFGSPIVAQRGQALLSQAHPVLSQPHLLQSPMVTANTSLRQTPSPITPVNAPKSSSPLIVRHAQILPKPLHGSAPGPAASAQHIVHGANVQPQTFIRAPTSQNPVTYHQLMTSNFQPSFVHQGGKIIVQPSMSFCGPQPVVLENKTVAQQLLSHRMIVQNQQNQLGQTITQNVQNANSQNANVQNQSFHVQNSGFLQGNPMNSHGHVNVNSPGNSVNLLNLNAQPGSQIVIHGNPANSQGSIILGAIPSQLIQQMNSNGQGGQKFILNQAGVPIQSNTLGSNNFILNFGNGGLNLQGANLQSVAPVLTSQIPQISTCGVSHANSVQPQKPLANVVGQRQVARCAPTQFSSESSASGSNDDNILSKAMSLSDIEIDEWPGAAKDVGVSRLCPSVQLATASKPQPGPMLPETGSLQASDAGGVVSGGQVGAQGLVETVIPLSPQIQLALQKVQAQIKILNNADAELDPVQKQRLATLMQVQQKIIEHARQQASKLNTAPVQISEISQSDQMELGSSLGAHNEMLGLTNSVSPLMRQTIAAASVTPNVTAAPNVTMTTRSDLRVVDGKPVAAIAPMMPRTRLGRPTHAVAAAATNVVKPFSAANTATGVTAHDNATPGASFTAFSAHNVAGAANLSQQPIGGIGGIGGISIAIAGNMKNTSELNNAASPTPNSLSFGNVKTSSVIGPSSYIGCLDGAGGIGAVGMNTSLGPSAEIPVQTQIKVGTHVLNMSLTPGQKLKIESHLARLTPQQQENVFQHQQALLARSQKPDVIVNKAAEASPSKPVLLLDDKQPPPKPFAVRVTNNPIRIAPHTAVKGIVPAPVAAIGTIAPAAPVLAPRIAAKRPASTAPLQPTIPGKIAMIRKELENDRQAVIEACDRRRPFTTWFDVCRRLTRYHVLSQPDIPQRLLYMDDIRVEDEARALLDKSQLLMNQFRRTLLHCSIKEQPSSEHVMLEKLFMESERQLLKEEREQAINNPVEFIPKPKLECVIDLVSASESPDSDHSDRFPDNDYSFNSTNIRSRIAERSVRTDPLQMRSCHSLSVNLSSDNLNHSLQLSPVSVGSPADDFTVPSLNWIPSPSENKGPLKLVLRKSQTGFEHQSPAPMLVDSDENEECDEEVDAEDDDELEENGEGVEEDGDTEEVDDEELAEDDNDVNDEEDGDDINYVEEDVEDSESTEMEESPGVDYKHLPEFATSALAFRAPSMATVPSRGDDELSPSLRFSSADLVHHVARDFGNDNSNIFCAQNQFLDPITDTFDLDSAARFLQTNDAGIFGDFDLSDQMQSAIDSILSLQETKDLARSQRQERLASELSSSDLLSSDDIDAAVQSIMSG